MSPLETSPAITVTETVSADPPVSVPAQGTALTLGEAARGRENNFDFLRFFLACLVILAHSFFLLDRGSAEPLVTFSHGQMDSGTFAVYMFFIISGYLITTSWQNSSGTKSYLFKRILRIYPGFIVAVLISIFVFGSLGSTHLPDYLHQVRLPTLPLRLATLHKMDALPTFAANPKPNEINGSLWSIAIEFQCYLVVIALGLAGLLRQRLWGVGLFVLCLLVHLGQTYSLPILSSLTAHIPASLNSKFTFLACFLAGMNLYLYRDKIAYSRRLLLSALGVLGLTSQFGGLSVAMMTCGAYVLFYIAFSKQIKLQHWGKRGDLSYGIYLYAWPIQQTLIAHLGAGLHPYTLAVLTLAPTCAMAALSWFCIEKPFLRLKKRPAPLARNIAVPSVQS